MDTTQFHTQYAASMAAFLSQLPDPGLRIAVRQQGDPFFRQCALAVWQAGGTPLSPAHTAWYNALYSGSVRPPDVLFWALTAQAGGCTALPAPPFFSRLCTYDRQTGHRTARAFLKTTVSFPLRPGRRPRDPGGSIGHRVLSGPVVHPMAAGEPAGKPRTPCPFPARLPRSAACAYPRPRPSDPRSLRPDGGAHDRGPVGPAGRAVWTGNR